MPNQTRQSSQERKLASLAALSQLYGSLQAPQLQQQEEQRRAQSSQQAAMLQMLGLSQQNDNAAADRTSQENYHNAVIGEQQANRQGDEAFRTKQLEADDAGRKATTDAHVFSTIFNDPSVPFETKMKFAPASAQPVVQGMHQQATQQGIGQLQPQLSAVYQANQNNPTALNAGLGALEQAYGSRPEVWNGVDWNALNSSLPGAGAASSSQPNLGAALGGAIHAIPAGVGGAMQGAEDWMTNQGQGFWAGLLGLKPQPPDTRPFEQKVKESKAWPWQ